MGQIFCRNSNYVVSKKEVRILMQGLAAAGKTTILYRLKLGEVISTVPTIGLIKESMTYKNISITALDVGGRCFVRPLYRYFAMGTGAILFVVDSNDRERLEEVKDELGRLLQEDMLQNTVFLILANKQDLPNALTSVELADALNFRQIMKSHRGAIMDCCAVTGDGLYEALDWLSQELMSTPSPTLAPSDTGDIKQNKTVTKTSEKISENKQETTAWSFKSYVKGSFETFKTLLPKRS